MQKLKLYAKQIYGTALAGAILTASANAAAECPIPELPQAFKAEQKFFAIGNDFDLKVSNGSSVGKIEQRIFRLKETFEFLDPKGQKLATGKKRIFSFGSTVDVYDCEDRLIGTVKEEIFRSLFKVSTRYTILDPAGNKVASSEKLELLGTKFGLGPIWWTPQECAIWRPQCRKTRQREELVGAIRMSSRPEQFALS